MADKAQLLKDDFRLFATNIWRHLGLPQPTGLQYDIASYLQTGPKRRVIEAFRGCGKSWLTAAYVLWRLYQDPQEKILVVSASKERADSFSIFVQQLINEIPWLRHLRPRDDQRSSKISFDVGPAEPHQQPSVRSVGITGQMTGSRAHRIIADDVEVPGNALTQGMRDRLWESVKEFDAILLPGGEVTYLGTPQTIMSLYNELPNRGYDVRIWPARKPTPEEVVAYGGKLAPYIEGLDQADGTSTEPSRFSDMDLAEREMSYGRSGFRLQFMLDTTLSDANRYPLKLEDLVVMPVDPTAAPLEVVWGPDSKHGAWDELPNVGLPGDGYYRPMSMSRDETAPYTGRAMFVDPAGRGRDETGYAVVYFLHGRLYVPRGGLGGLSGGYDEIMEFLAGKAQEHKVNIVLVESNFGDGMFEELLKPVMLRKGYPCQIEGVRNAGQKELRVIDTLEPVMNSHRLVIDPENIKRDYEEPNTSQGMERARDYMAFFQMSHITRDRGSLRHDDRLEALSGAVRYWVDQMAHEEQRSATAYRDRLLDAELERFKKHVLGGSPVPQEGFLGGV